MRRSLVLYDKVSRRYRLHELIRVFAHSLLSEVKRAVSEKEFAGYYLRVLEKSNQLYLQSGLEYSQGLHMFRTERENIRHGWALSSRAAEIDAEIAEICWTYTRVGIQYFAQQIAN